MSNREEYPYKHAVEKWMAEPGWVWQVKPADGCEWVRDETERPPRQGAQCGYRLVPQAWLDGHPGLLVWVRPRLVVGKGVKPGWFWNYLPHGLLSDHVWDHSFYEYRIEVEEREAVVDELQTLTLPPRTIPVPMKGAPAIGSGYFVADPMAEDWFHESYWGGDDFDWRRLERGLCFHTKEQAQIAAKVMAPLREMVMSWFKKVTDDTPDYPDLVHIFGNGVHGRVWVPDCDEVVGGELYQRVSEEMAWQAMLRSRFEKKHTRPRQPAGSSCTAFMPDAMTEYRCRFCGKTRQEHESSQWGTRWG